MRQFAAEILGNREVAESWRELRLSWDAAAGVPLPGQFFTLKVSPYSDPLLRRPFAFSGYESSSASGASVSALYQVRGGATRLLAELASGAPIDLIGPLGRPFPAPRRGELALLAGGGIGLGPILFLAQALAASPQQPDAVRLAIGLRSASSLPSLSLPEGTVLCTDDGSAGFHGTPVDWISREVSDSCARLYGCGPAPMLAALADLAAARGWGASLSAEQWMACGVGACMGCALPRADGEGYLRACADGPVFEGGEIDWRPR